MSHWDPEPSSGERWMVRHRTQIRVGAALVILFGTCRIVYLLVTGARLGWSLDGSIPLITSPCIFLFLTWNASRHVENYDNARAQGPNSE
jgi:uncharacterized membrane protein